MEPHSVEPVRLPFSPRGMLFALTSGVWTVFLVGLTVIVGSGLRWLPAGLPSAVGTALIPAASLTATALGYYVGARRGR